MDSGQWIATRQHRTWTRIPALDGNAGANPCGGPDACPARLGQLSAVTSGGNTILLDQ